MPAAANQVADRVVRPSPVDRRTRHVTIVQGVHPLLAPVAEGGIQPANGEARRVAHPVIAAARYAPACAVVHVVPQVHAVVVRAEAVDGWRRFDVVDAAAIPIVRAADEDAHALVSAEALADGG